jgi:hypothetical protein
VVEIENNGQGILQDVIEPSVCIRNVEILKEEYKIFKLSKNSFSK